MATQRSVDVAPYLAGPAYGVGFLFVVLPIIDTLSQVWPVALGSPTWRYGTVGLGSNYLVSLVFGMWLLCFVAAQRLDRRTLLTLAMVSAAMAVLALVATLGFILDVLQVRPSVPKDSVRALWSFDVGAAKAVFKYLASTLVLGWLALSSRRAWRAIPRHASDEPARLVREQQAKA